MPTKLRLSEMTQANSLFKTRDFTVKQGIAYLDAVPGLIRFDDDDRILWIGEGCDQMHWIAIFESTPGRFRVVKEVKFAIPAYCQDDSLIKTFAGQSVYTLDELDAKVQDAMFQLKKAREQLAEYTRIKRKAEVRDAARQFEM